MASASHRRAAVVYLLVLLQTAVNKWRRSNSCGSTGTRTLGFADWFCHGRLSSAFFFLLSFFFFFFSPCFIYPFIMPQLPLTLIPVVVIEFSLINLSPILLYSQYSLLQQHLFNLRNNLKEKLRIINVSSSGTLFGTGDIHLCGTATPSQIWLHVCVHTWCHI